MHLLMTGLSYKTADVGIREQVAFGATRLPDSLRDLVGYPSLQGAVILSTCNRMEIYVQTDDRDSAHAGIVEFIATSRGIAPEVFMPHLYSVSDRDAVDHLFSVVCSLDSMVLGEQQIIAQVRQAFKISIEAETMTPILDRLFRQALGVGKQVLTETDISHSHVSLSTVAIDVARATFPDLDQRNVLIVGSGEMCELAARYLFEQGVRSFIVSSRTHAHACTLADELGGIPRRFDELPSLLPDADIVISGTAAPHCVIDASAFQQNDHPVLLLDIAMPRDIDPACACCPGVILRDLDDLGHMVETNQEFRRVAADAARSIVAQEVDAFICWVREHGVTPTIKEIRSRAEEVRVQEADRLIASIHADLSEGDRVAIHKATSAIVNKLLHEPTTRMREGMSAGAGLAYVEAARYLFGLSERCGEPFSLRSADAVEAVYR